MVISFMDSRRELRKIDKLRKNNYDLYLSVKKIIYANNCRFQLACRLLVYKMDKNNQDYIPALITFLQLGLYR